MSQDYNAIEKWAMTAHLRAEVFGRKIETRKEKELSRKSVIDSEERVLKIIAAIKEYENSFASSSTRTLKLKNIVTGSAVGPEYLNEY